MCELYFIGGTALSGKSEISTAFFKSIAPQAEKIPQYLGTDTIRRVLWSTLPDDEEPALVQMHKDRRTLSEAEWLKKAKTDPLYWVNRQHKEQEVVWRRGVLPALESNISRGLPTLVEGIAVLPQFLASLEFPHRAIFVGNNTITKKHRENVHKTVHSVPDHWMRTWSKQKIDVYLDYLVPAYAARLEQLCKQYGYTYIDLSKGDFAENQKRASQFLFSQQPLTAPAG